MSQGTPLNEVHFSTRIYRNDKLVAMIGPEQSKEERPEIRHIAGVPCVVLLGPKQAPAQQGRDVLCIPLSSIASFTIARDQLEI